MASTDVDDLQRKNAALRERLSRLSEASRRVTEDLDLDVVLQEVADGARLLTSARTAGLTILDEDGQLQDFITSGLSAEERQQLIDWPDGIRFFSKLSAVLEPLRLDDILDYAAAQGLTPGVDPPTTPWGPFLGAPIRMGDRQIGNFYLGGGEGAGEFSAEDEEVLAMFADQAALAITNARRHQSEQRARADLQTLIDTTPVGVVVFDAHSGVLVSYNQEVARMMDSLLDPDQSPEELLPVLIFRRADGREFSLAVFPLAEALRASETVHAEEITISIPDGRSITALVNAGMIRSDEGDAESLIVTLQDMTSLQEHERMRAEFLAMVSHEMRRPLAAIKGSAAAAQGGNSRLDAAETRQFFRIIEDQADSAFDLINDLLDVARIEAGALPLEPEPTDVSVLIEQARVASLSREGRHNIGIDAPTDLPRVMVDRRRTVQVIGNLLDNAARHSPERAPIRIAAVEQDEHVLISIEDQGVGVAQERLPELFRKFSRLDPEAPASGSLSSGLGLALCKELVEAQGGRIWAESDGPGRGTRFSFTIPLAEETPTVPAQLPASLNRSRGQASAQQARILAVDDDPLALRYVHDALVEAGYAVIATGDQEEARQLMEAEQPHLALLDLMLPETDGIELMQDLLKIADIPMIFLSNYGKDQVIAKAFDLGADDYIVKPFSPTELVARIRTAIRRRSARTIYPDEPYLRGDLRIDFAERKVTLAGQTLQLTSTEHDLLCTLAANAGRVMTFQQLLGQVWGRHSKGDARVIRTCLLRLRGKLDEDGSNPKYIFSEPRVGYRMVEADRP